MSSKATSGRKPKVEVVELVFSRRPKPLKSESVSDSEQGMSASVAIQEDESMFSIGKLIQDLFRSDDA